jgi:phosphate/phosphite/phosphonate ABC transporter binding protein
MARWRDRLEVRALLLAIVLPLAGVLLVTFAVVAQLRRGFLADAERQSAQVAEIVARNVERTMLGGLADVTRAAVKDLRETPGVAGLDILNDEGREAFVKGAPVLEAAALERLRVTGRPHVVRDGQNLVYYRPLPNADGCRKCHDGNKPILGAAKVSIPVRGAISSGTSLAAAALAWSVAGVAVMGLLLGWAVRRHVVLPVRRIHGAAVAVAAGDLTVDAAVAGRGEIAELGEGLRDAVRSLAGLVTRIHDVARRVEAISAKAELESAEVVHGTAIEAASFGNIAASIEELNASIGQISGELGGLSTVAETVHAAATQTAANTAEVLVRARELATGVGAVSATIGEMTHTTRELSWGTTQLSEVSSETLKAVQTLEGTVRTVEARSRESAGHSEQVRREAEELGVRAVRRTIEGMELVRDAVGRASRDIASLDQRSRQIGEILDVITDVNDQTALLALNAAILAAQAGAHGAGFQVVASEIRQLSVRTAGSTVEIAGVIAGVRAEVSGAVAAMKDGLEKVDAGLALARASGTALEKITTSAHTATGAAVSIQETTREQTQGLATVREAMIRLEQMAQFIAAGSAEQQRGFDGLHASARGIEEASGRIQAANDEQSIAGRHIAEAAERVSDGIRRMAQAVHEEKEGCAQIMHSLVRVVDLPRQNRALSLRINQGLREVHGGTELLSAEVERFRVPPDTGGGVLRLGVVPLESPATMHRRFTPLAAWLSARVGRPVELRVALDFDETLRDLGEGRTDAAYLSPSTYLQARRGSGVELIATALRNGSPFQHSSIVTRRGSGITRLTDLRGKSFAFGDRRSTSSHLVPRSMLLAAGVPLEQLAAFEYLGHHDTVAQAVLNGEYDAGAVMEAVAARHAAEGLVVVAASPPIPEFCICASPLLPPVGREALRGALLGLTDAAPGGREVLEALASSYTGFAAAREADYDTISRMLEKLGPEAQAGPS